LSGCIVCVCCCCCVVDKVTDGTEEVTDSACKWMGGGATGRGEVVVLLFFTLLRLPLRTFDLDRPEDDEWERERE